MGVMRSDCSMVAASATPHRIARSQDLRGDRPYAFSVCGVDIVVMRTGKGLRAFQGRCPHQGALLGEGALDGQTLTCRNHGWRFRVESGRREGGPHCLDSFPIREEDGDVFVTVPIDSEREAQRPVGRRELRDLPGPKTLPLLGNLLQLDMSRLHEILEGWAAVHGPLYRYRLGPRWVVVVSDPALGEQVLKARPETYRRLSAVEPVFAEMGLSGVFSAEGDAWRPQRRLAMEALSFRHLQGFYPTLRTVAERLRKRWLRAADDGTPVDIVEDLKRFTVDVTTLLTFGHDVNTIEQDDEVIQRRLELVFPAFNSRLFALFPTWRLLRLPADRRLDQALIEIRAWLQELVAKARRRLEADPASADRPSNFLEAMISARDEAGQPFSDEVIFGNLMTMLLAGEDTTAYTLAWAVHHLSDSPSSVTALRSELDAVLGSSAVPEDFDTAHNLAYAGAAANETMRLRPVAPVFFHDTNVETVLGDLRLPANTTVAVLTRPPARDPKNFDEPCSFRPERWLDAGGGAHEPSAHIPFGTGPRLCPGRTLALLEMKVVLATVYKTFDVARVGESATVRERFAFTMSPDGLRVRLNRRP